MRNLVFLIYNLALYGEIILKKTFFKILAFILGFLATSCDLGINNDPPIHVMYGIPTTEYKISGFVKDNQNTPIEGIEINFHFTSTYTNPDGSFSIDEELSSFHDSKLYAVDIDGTENGGEFQSEEFDLNLTETDEQHDIEIILDEKEE